MCLKGLSRTSFDIVLEEEDGPNRLRVYESKDRKIIGIYHG
jgi:hypothetical protein